jgi:hypothetical protein
MARRFATIFIMGQGKPSPYKVVAILGAVNNPG